MPPEYYAVRETDSYEGVLLHEDRNCPDGPVRAAGSTVYGEPCPECTDVAVEDEDDEPDTCQVELSAGGTCGRERPCPYHS